MSVTNWLLGPNDKRSPWFRTHSVPGSVNGIDLVVDSFANLMLPGANHYVNWIKGATQKPANKPKKEKLVPGVNAPVAPALPSEALVHRLEGQNQRQPAPETSVEKPAGGGSGGVGPSNTESRTNANGVTQTGRNLGKINLTPSAGVADFTGPSFPTQAATNQISAPYSNTTPEGFERVDLGEGTFGLANKNGRIMGLEGNPAQKPGTSVQLPETETSSYQTFDANDPRFADAFGEDLAKSLGGTSRYGDSGAERPQKSGGRRRSGDIRDRDIDARGGFDPRSDRRGGSEDESAFKPADYAISGQEARRRAAFLSSPGGSLGGIKAVDDGLGRKREGGKTYFAVNGEYREVDSDDFRELGQIDQSGVDAWRSNWMKENIKSDTAESGVPTPAAAQEPANQGKQIQAAEANFNPQQPRLNDFTVNNKITPQYGAAGNKGYDSFGNPPKLNTVKPSDFKMNNNVWGG